MGFASYIERKDSFSFDEDIDWDGGIQFEFDRRHLVNTAYADMVAVFWRADANAPHGKANIAIVTHLNSSLDDGDPIRSVTKKFYSAKIFEAFAWLEDETI